jgi:hypothetical protein
MPPLMAVCNAVVSSCTTEALLTVVDAFVARVNVVPDIALMVVVSAAHSRSAPASARMPCPTFHVAALATVKDAVPDW